MIYLLLRADFLKVYNAGQRVVVAFEALGVQRPNVSVEAHGETTAITIADEATAVLFRLALEGEGLTYEETTDESRMEEFLK